MRFTASEAAVHENKAKILEEFPANLGLFVCSVSSGRMARGPSLPVITDLITYYLFYNLFFKTKTTTIICLKEFSFLLFFFLKMRQQTGLG